VLDEVERFRSRIEESLRRSRVYLDRAYESLNEADMLMEGLVATVQARALREAPDEPQVVSDVELREGIMATLRGLGVTVEDLRRQAQTGRWESERLRLLWVAIGSLVKEGFLEMEDAR
jgi:hypothetical protein